MRLFARRRREEAGGWSPFARNDGADCEAVAQALLTAVEHEACALDHALRDWERTETLVAR